MVMAAGLPLKVTSSERFVNTVSQGLLDNESATEKASAL